MKYQIENTSSGIILGVYEASSKEEALDLMAREAGYASYEEAQEAAPSRPGEILVVEMDGEESSINVSLTKEGVTKVIAWLAEVAKPGVRKAVVLTEVEEHIWESYPSSPSYELGAQYTRSGRPEILHLVEGVDYAVEV